PLEPLEVVDDGAGTGLAQLVRGVGRGDADHAHARAPRRLDADDGVLEHEALPGRHADPPRGEQVHLRVGLAEAHVFGGDDRVEALPEPEPTEESVDVETRGGGGLRARLEERVVSITLSIWAVTAL